MIRLVHLPVVGVPVGAMLVAGGSRVVGTLYEPDAATLWLAGGGRYTQRFDRGPLVPVLVGDRPLRLERVEPDDVEVGDYLYSRSWTRSASTYQGVVTKVDRSRRSDFGIRRSRARHPSAVGRTVGTWLRIYCGNFLVRVVEVSG